MSRKNDTAIKKQEVVYVSVEKMKEREQNYANRLTELRKCLGFVDDARLEISRLDKEDLVKEKWEDYVNCNPLPKPYVPPAIRLFYDKIKHFEKENIDRNINWLLSVDERSILTQNIYRQNKTRRNLSLTLKKNIGAEYDTHINNLLKILERIEWFLDFDQEVAKCPLNILDDVVSLKSAVQENIKDLIDSFTFRIISSDSEQMNSIDAITSEYFFNAEDFAMHIWCLKNVPIRFNQLSEPRLLAKFHSIKVTLQIPTAMLRKNLVVRAVHINFDHLSQYAKSFSQSLPPHSENFSAGMFDLHECLVYEWLMQTKMQTTIHHEMEELRMEYEEKLKQQEEQLLERRKERNEKEKRTSKSAKNTKIVAVVPPKIEPGMLPDVHEQFLQEEQNEYENFCKSIYAPELLNLTSDEINLKKCLILGGVYQLYYVEKPTEITYDGFNINWKDQDSKLVIYKDVKIIPQSKSQMDFTRRSKGRMTIYEAEMGITDANVNSPWFIVTVELPEYLCYWGEPIACQFEEKTKRVEVVKSKSMKSTEKDLRKSQVSWSSRLNLKPTSTTSDSYSHLNLNPFLSQNDKFVMKRKLLAASQRRSRESIFQDSLANVLLQRMPSEISKKSSVHTITVNDFFISNILEKEQIRELERHITPRIISSYKFPREVHLEEVESLKFKRTKGGKLVRKKTDHGQSKPSIQLHSFNVDQHNAERMFAKYPIVNPLLFPSKIKTFKGGDYGKYPETFAELVDVIEHVKNVCRSRVNKILETKPLDHPVVVHNKRIKQMLKKKEIPLTGSTPADSSIEIPSNPQTNISTGENLLAKKEGVVMKTIEQKEPEYELQTYRHWTTKHIFKTEFDKKNFKYVIYTDRLGTLGFAFDRYEHFPFKYWRLEPNPEDPANEVIFTLDTQHVRCVLYITSKGIKGYVTDPIDAYVRDPKKYLEIKEPINDYKVFKETFRAKNINIFAEHDARFYIQNGYFSEKHLSTEMHTYNCMAVHCTQMQFSYALWNRLASRRDIILNFKQYKDVAENLVQARIIPGEAFFVDVLELCSDDLDIIKLDYVLTWRNLDAYSDLHHLIISMYPIASETRCRNSNIICCIKDMLSEIRPLSFS